MPSDTFVGNVHNPIDPSGDITKVIAFDIADASHNISLIENGTVNFNFISIGIGALVKNTGEIDGSFTVTLYIDSVQKEQQTVSIAAGQNGDVTFNNAGAGYTNTEGKTYEYKVTVTP